MNSRSKALQVAGMIFGLMCAAQTLRLATRAEVRIAGHPLPLRASALAIAITGGLSCWMWNLPRAEQG